MSKNIVKKTTYDCLPLNISLKRFLLFEVHVLFNLSKDFKIGFAYKIIEMIVESLRLLRKSYYEVDLNFKLDNTLKIYDNIDDVSNLMKILYEMKIISENNITQTYKHIGDIKSQLLGWQKSLKEKINGIETEND